MTIDADDDDINDVHDDDVNNDDDDGVKILTMMMMMMILRIFAFFFSNIQLSLFEKFIFIQFRSICNYLLKLLHQARDVLEKASEITSHRFSYRVHATEELNQVAEALDTTPISFYLSLGIELSYDKDYLEKHLARKLMTS